MIRTVCGFGFFFLALTAACGPAGDNAPPKDPPPGKVMGKVYANPGLGFSFRIPDTWKFITSGKKLNVLTAAVRDTVDAGLADLVTVRFETKYGAGAVTEKLDATVRSIKKFFRNFEVVKKDTVTVAGRTAGLLISRFSAVDDPVSGNETQRLYLLPHAGGDITFDFVETDDPVLTADRETILASVRLDRPSASALH